MVTFQLNLMINFIVQKDSKISSKLNSSRNKLFQFYSQKLLPPKKTIITTLLNRFIQKETPLSFTTHCFCRKHLRRPSLFFNYVHYLLTSEIKKTTPEICENMKTVSILIISNGGEQEKNEQNLSLVIL